MQDSLEENNSWEFWQNLTTSDWKAIYLTNRSSIVPEEANKIIRSTDKLLIRIQIQAW